MVSVGSVSIDLTLNRSQFDADLRKLSQENVGDLSVQARLDTKDFDRQIKGLTGFLPTLSIPVELDLAQFKQQVSQLGKESVSIQVGLDRSQFDSDLRSLQQETTSFSVKIEIDALDVERQIKGLTGFLPTLSIPVELDDRNFSQQLQGIKDATKNLDCIPLEICPNIDGLKQKLKTISSVDLDCLPLEICPDVEGLKRKLKAIGNVDIDCIPIDLCPESKSFDKKVKDAVGRKGYSTTVGLDTDDFGKRIEHSFETALRKVEGKGIFGNLISTIAAPLKFVGSLLKESISGAFLGVGLPIGEQLGHGIAKGVEGQVNQVIGSVDILGEKIAQKLPGAVSAKIQQVPLLKALFSQESVQDAQKELASFLKESVVGADEILVETLAQTTRKKQQTATVRQEAGQEAGRQYDRALAESPKDAITQDLIKAQLKQASRAADTASDNLTQFQETSDLTQAAKPEDREKIREESLLKQAELLRKQEAAAKEVAKLQAQLNQSRSRVSGSVSQLEKVGIDTSDVTQAQKNLENITAKGKERTEALTAQIKALYAARQNAQERFDAAIESKDVTGARSARVDAAKSDAEIAVVEQNFKEYTKFYKQAASQAEKELKQAQASLLKATAFPDKSLEQLESSITPRQKLNLVGLKASAESGVSQIQLQKDFLQDDLNKQTAGIGGDTGRTQAEGLRDKLKARSDRLRETIDSAKATGDTSSSRTSVDELNTTLEQLRLVDNTLRPLEALETEIKGLDAILENAKKQKEQIDKAVDTKIKSIEQDEARLQKTVALSKNPQQEASSSAPQIYTDIVQQSAQLAGLQPIPQELIPKLEPSAEVAGRGDYNAKTNTYRIRPDLHQQLQTNDIEQISEEAVGNIIHEIYHAFQHGFGKAIADNTGKPAVNLQPTPEELLLVRDKVESSVSIQPDSRKDLSRELEIGANVFQNRNTPVVTDQLKRQQYAQQALSLGGVGGARISLTEVNKLVDEDISPFLQLAKELNVDVGKTKEALISKINSIRERSDAAGAKSIDIKSLSTEEIKTVVGEYEQLLKEIEQIRAIVPGLRAKAQSKASETQELKEELTIQMQKPQLKRLAKDLGISGISNKNKPEMVEAIVQSGVTATDIKAKLPTFNIPTEEILLEVQKVLQLTSEDLTQSTKLLVNGFKLKLKSAQGTFLDEERLSELQQILLEIDKAELVYIAAKSKTLDEGVKAVLNGRILSLQKARVATNSEIKSVLPGAASIKGQVKNRAVPVQQQSPNGNVDAEALFPRRTLEEEEDAELFGNEPVDTGAKAKRTTRRTKKRFNFGRIKPNLDLIADKPLPSEHVPTISDDFLDPNNFTRIPAISDPSEEALEREASVRQNSRNLPEIKYTTPVEHVPSLSGDFADPNNNFARIPGFPSSYEEILAEQKSKSLVPLPSMGFPHPKDVNPTLSGDFADPNNNFARIPGFPSSYEEIIEQEIRSREDSVRQNSRNLPAIKYTTPTEHVPSLSGDFADPNNNFARIPGFPSSYEEILAEQKSKSLVPLPSMGFPHPKDVNPTLSGDFANPNGPTEKTTFYTADIPVIKPISVFPEQEKLDLVPDVLNRKLKEQSKRVEDSSARLDRRLKKQEEEYLNSVEKRVAKNSTIVDKTIKEIEVGANEQIKEIENNVNFDEQLEKRKSRRNAVRIQQKHGLDDTEAPRVEPPLPEVKSTALSLGSVLRDIKDSRVESVKKQALALGQQTQILLADIQTQIVLGDNARKESLVLESQIKENERSLDKILNAIGKAKAGKDPAQSAERIQKLSEQVESLIARIDEDKERLAGLQPTIKSGKDLTPIANELVNVASKSQELLGKDNLSDNDLDKLQKYNQEIKVLFEDLGHPPIPPSNLFEKLKGDLGGIGKSAFEAVKGFLAFQAIITIQNSLSSFAQDAFKAYVEIDKLKTALNFASGGTAGGAANLKFVNKEVDNLAIPLQASIQGFTQLASAARGTNLEGQQTKDIFDGLSKASTVLSLSADDTSSAFDAFSKAISQGKVSAETFEQLGTRIPGIYGVAARAIGTTEEEFKRLIETGQVGQDGIGRIGKQLQSEYGRDSEGASDNAQSAVFKLQNSSQQFQQGIGEGIAPVVVPGLKLLTEALNIAKNGVKELLALLASVATVLAVNVASSLKTVIVNLLGATTQAGTLGAGLRVLATTINNSFEIKLGAAIFGVLEIIKLLNDQVNTDLVKSFEASADAATRAAIASEKAFEAEQKRRLGQKPLAEEEESPRASSGAGRFADDYLINPANFILQHTFTNISKIATTGQSEKTRALDNDKVEQQATTELLAGASLRENEIKNQSGELGQLPQIDKDLRDKSNQQQILDARSRRDFTDKGLPIPAKIKTQLTQDSIDINILTNKRSEIAKPYDDTLADLNQRYNAYKAKLEGLKTPEAINNLGQKKIDELTESYKKNIEAILLQKNSLAAAEAAFNVNPILTFTDAFRKLNVTLASGQETNQQRAIDRNFQSAQANFSGFATNRLAGKERSLTDAITARDVASSDAENQQKLLNGLNEQLTAPGLQPQLQRLGVSPTSSVAQVSDILANTKDESDKAILEKIKAAREQELKTKQANVTAVDAKQKVQQVTQENTLGEIQFGAANVTAAIQQGENVKTAAVKKGLQARTISETEASEKIARIQFNSTKIQQRNVDTQLAVLNEYHKQGKVGAELFAEKQRELATEQTNLQKQSAEQQLAVFDATNARKLEALELANKKAEAVINQKQASRAIAIKQGVVKGDIDPTIDAPKQQNLVDQEAARGEIALINKKIEQNRYEKAQKIITAKAATENEIALKQQLAQADTKLVDLQIQSQEQLRAEVEHNFQIEKQRLELKTVQATTEVKKGIFDAKLDSIEAPKKQNEIDQETARAQIEFVKSEIAKTKEQREKGLLSKRAANDKELALNIELAQANQGLIDKQIQGQENYRAAIEKNFQRRKQQLELEVSQSNTSVQQQFLDQFKQPEVDEKGLELAKTGVTLNTQSISTARQIGTLQEQLAGVDKLNYAEKDAADKKRELLAEIERLRQQQIQTETDLIKNKQEQEINGIERAQKAEENRFKLATGYLEQEKAGLELLSQSLERTTKLEQSRNDLRKAVSDAAVSGLEIRRDVANRALELSRKVSDPNTDPLVRNEATRQLQNAGFGTNELSILQQRQKIEDEIASKKLEALKTEQEFQRESLQLDLKRQLIAAQTAEFEAESGQLAAQKARLEADAELRKAQIKKDPIEIQSAKVGVELTSRGIELAERRLESSKENVLVQDELAKNATQAQEATQKGAIAQEVAADNARKQANALESVEALASQLSKSLNPGGSGGGKDSSSTKDWVNPFIPKKGEKPFDYNLRINKAKMFGEIQETRNTVNIAGPGVTVTPATVTASTGTDPAQNGTLANTKKTPDATYAQFSQSLKSANQGIEERLDKIINSVNKDPLSLLPTDKSLKIDKNILPDTPPVGSRNGGIPVITPRPGENIFEAYMRQREESQRMPMIDSLPSGKNVFDPTVKPRPGENIFEAYQRQREERFNVPVDKTAESLANSTIKPVDTTTGFLQFTESLKSANQGIEQRLDKLIDSMATSNKTPRSLTVMSHSPVDDAASLINDLSRGELMGAGL